MKGDFSARLPGQPVILHPELEGLLREDSGVQPSPADLPAEHQRVPACFKAASQCRTSVGPSAPNGSGHPRRGAGPRARVELSRNHYVTSRRLVNHIWDARPPRGRAASCRRRAEKPLAGWSPACAAQTRATCATSRIGTRTSLPVRMLTGTGPPLADRDPSPQVGVRLPPLRIFASDLCKWVESLDARFVLPRSDPVLLCRAGAFSGSPVSGN
jgi:hypothetical protein